MERYGYTEVLRSTAVFNVWRGIRKFPRGKKNAIVGGFPGGHIVVWYRSTSGKMVQIRIDGGVSTPEDDVNTNITPSDQPK